MDDSDDDSSSDSSSDFGRGFTNNDELTASFFSIKPRTGLANAKREDSEDESNSSDDDDNFTSVPEDNGIELFSEVVKNLEAAQRIRVDSENPEQRTAKDDGARDVKSARSAEKSNNISDEINAVLLQGEGEALRGDDGDTDDGEGDEQEEDVKPPAEYTIPKEGVKITLPGTSVFLRKKTSGKKESDLASILRRRLKANQIFVEKVSRLCWLAHGFHLNRQANNPETMTSAVSLVPVNNYPKDKFDLEYLAKFTKWFRNMFAIEPTDDEVAINKETLLKRLAERKVCNYRELVVLYVAVLRGIGLNCRLIVSLNPPSVKAYSDLLPKAASAAKKNDRAKEKPKEKTKAKSTKEDTKAKSSKEGTRAKSSSKKDTKTKFSKEDTKNTDSKKDLSSDNSIFQNSESARKDANLAARKKAAEILRSKYSYNKKSGGKSNNTVSTQNNTAEVKGDEAASTSAQEANTVTSPRYLRSGKALNAASTVAKRQNNPSGAIDSKGKSESTDFDSSSEEEEEMEKPSSKAKRKRNSDKTRTNVKSKVKKEKKDHESTDGEEEADDSDKVRRKQDLWAEVYVESKGSWISVNVMDGNVDCVVEVYVSKIR